MVLDDGLHVVDPDARTSELLSPPTRTSSRAVATTPVPTSKATSITGKLNLGPAEGSAWWYSVSQGWRVLDRDISNTNGPTVGVLDGVMTLVIGDTSADYYSYPYDAVAGTVGHRASSAT